MSTGCNYNKEYDNIVPFQSKVRARNWFQVPLKYKYCCTCIALGLRQYKDLVPVNSSTCILDCVGLRCRLVRRGTATASDAPAVPCCVTSLNLQKTNTHKRPTRQPCWMLEHYGKAVSPCEYTRRSRRFSSRYQYRTLLLLLILALAHCHRSIARGRKPGIWKMEGLRENRPLVVFVSPRLLLSSDIRLL